MGFLMCSIFRHYVELLDFNVVWFISLMRILVVVFYSMNLLLFFKTFVNSLNTVKLCNFD